MASSANKTHFLRSVAIRGYSAQAAPKASKKPAEIQTTTLPNKLVVASVDSHSPISRVSVLFKAGSRYENYDNLGVTHMLRATAGLTTKNSTTFGIIRNLQQVGGSLSVTTDREAVSYNVELTSDQLETGLKYLQDVAATQIFKPWEVDEVIPRLKEDLARIPDQVLAVDLLHKAAYRTGLGNSIFCPKHQAGKISCETLQHYVASNFTTSRAAVIGVGVDHSLLVGYAQNLPLASGTGKENSSKYAGLGELRVDKAGQLAHVAIATEGSGILNTKEAIAFGVLQYAAGTGPSTKRGNTNGALGKVVSTTLGSKPFGFKAFNSYYTDSGLFGFVVSANGSDICKAVEAAVKTLKSGCLSQEDINRGKAQLKADLLFSLENGSYLAADIGIQALLMGNVQGPLAWAAAIDAISASDVNAAARKAASGKLSLGAVGNLVTLPYIDQLN